MLVIYQGRFPADCNSLLTILFAFGPTVSLLEPGEGITLPKRLMCRMPGRHLPELKDTVECFGGILRKPATLDVGCGRAIGNVRLLLALIPQFKGHPSELQVAQNSDP